MWWRELCKWKCKWNKNTKTNSRTKTKTNTKNYSKKQLTTWTQDRPSCTREKWRKFSIKLFPCPEIAQSRSATRPTISSHPPPGHKLVHGFRLCLLFVSFRSDQTLLLLFLLQIPQVALILLCGGSETFDGVPVACADLGLISMFFLIVFRTFG